MNFWIGQGEETIAAAESLSGERFRLSLERIRQMQGEALVHPAYAAYFQDAAGWILLLLDHARMLEDGSFEKMSIEELAAANRALYREILPENYHRSWADPGFAIRAFGKEHGQVMSALYYELRCMIPLVYEGDAERFLTRMELLLEVYFAFVTARREALEEREKTSAGLNGRLEAAGAEAEPVQGKTAGAEAELRDAVPEQRAHEKRSPASAGSGAGDGIPPAGHIRGKIRQFLMDYAAEETLVRVRRSLVGGGLPERILGVCRETGSCVPTAGRYIPGDQRCLYRYGAYVSENETGIFSYLEDLEEESAAKIADTWSEGYRIGFDVTGKDLSGRKRAGLFYHVGFERIALRAAQNLGKTMGLAAVVPGQQADLFTQHLGRGGAGIESSSPNPQYAYDHREDLSLFLNDALLARRLEALEQAYQALAGETVLFAGPAVLETFGEKPFSPVMHVDYPRFSPSWQKKTARFLQQADLLYDKAVVGKERSFTIIAFPLPEITRGYPDGDLSSSFEEIFRAVIEINTLDYMTWRQVQACLIEVLDTAREVHVVGQNGNRTDLVVRLQTPQDPAAQTIFENCVADVNIPVGEVFTTPELSGTEGTLHVTGVYLNGLFFKDLEIRFHEGRVASYRCGGFPTEEEGKKYIEENILFHHETLPMGEFAIGTNTTAAARAAGLGILERLPILIAEKTGPHFAVGDTCYSHEEENRVFNPDGKEIFAKDNAYSLLRDTDPENAYFGCHTDITIPYEEAGLLEAVRADGTRIPLIEKGRFVLPGTELLNAPLEARDGTVMT